MQGNSGGGGGGGGGGGRVAATVGESIFVTGGGSTSGLAVNSMSAAAAAAAEVAAAEAAAAATAGSSSSSEDAEVVVVPMARRAATGRLPRHPLLPPARPLVSPSPAVAAAVAAAAAAAEARGAGRGRGDPSATDAPRRTVKGYPEDGLGAGGKAAPAAAADVKPLVVMAGTAQPLAAGVVPGAGAAAAPPLSLRPAASLPPRPSPSLPSRPVASSPPPLQPLQSPLQTPRRPLQTPRRPLQSPPRPLQPPPRPLQPRPRPLVATPSVAATPSTAAGTQPLATAAEHPAAGVPTPPPTTAERSAAAAPTDTAGASFPSPPPRQLRTSPETPSSLPWASPSEASSSPPWEPEWTPADPPSRSPDAALLTMESTAGGAGALVRHASDQEVLCSVSFPAATPGTAVKAAVTAAKGAADEAAVAAASLVTPVASPVAVPRGTASPSSPPPSPLPAHSPCHATAGTRCGRTRTVAAAKAAAEATAQPPMGGRPGSAGAASPAAAGEPLAGPSQASPRGATDLRLAAAAAAEVAGAAASAPTAVVPVSGAGATSSGAGAAAPEAEATVPEVRTPAGSATPAVTAVGPAAASAAWLRPGDSSRVAPAAVEAPAKAGSRAPVEALSPAEGPATAEAPAPAAARTPAVKASPASASTPAKAPGVVTAAPPSADATPPATPPPRETPPSPPHVDDAATLAALCTQMRSIMDRFDGGGRGRRRRRRSSRGDADGGGASTGAAMAPAAALAGTADNVGTPRAAGATSDRTDGSGGVHRRPRRSSSSASPVSFLLDDQDDGVLSDPTDDPTGEAGGKHSPPFVTPTRPAGRSVVAAFRSTPATVTTRTAAAVTAAAAPAAPPPASVALPPSLTPLSPTLTPLQPLVGIPPARPPEAAAGSPPPQAPPLHSAPPPPPPLPSPDVDIPPYVAEAALAFGRAVGLTTHPASWGGGVGGVGSVGGVPAGSHCLGAGTWPLLPTSPLPTGFPYVGLRSIFTYLPDKPAEAPPPLRPQAAAAVPASTASTARGAATAGGERHPPPSTAVSPRRRSRRVMAAVASLSVSGGRGGGRGGGGSDDNDVRVEESSSDARTAVRGTKRQRLATGAAVTTGPATTPPTPRRLRRRPLAPPPPAPIMDVDSSGVQSIAPSASSSSAAALSSPASKSLSSASATASTSSASYGPPPVSRRTPSRGRSSPLPMSAGTSASRGGRRPVSSRGRRPLGAGRGGRGSRSGRGGDGSPKEAPPLSAADAIDAAVAAASSIVGDTPPPSSPTAAARAAAAAAMADGGAYISGGWWAATEGPLPPPPSRSAAAATAATEAAGRDREAVAVGGSPLPAGGAIDLVAAGATAPAAVGGDGGGGVDTTPLTGTSSLFDTHADTDVDADNSEASGDTRDRGVPSASGDVAGGEPPPVPFRTALRPPPPPGMGPGLLGVATAAAAWARGFAYVARGARDDAGADVAVDCLLAAGRLGAPAIAALAVDSAGGDRGALDDVEVLTAASVAGDDGSPVLPPPRTPGEALHAAAVLAAVPALRRLAAAKASLAEVLVEELRSAGLLTPSTGPSLVALAAAADALVDPPWPVAPIPDPFLPPSPAGDASLSHDDEDDDDAAGDAVAGAAAAIEDAAAGEPAARARRLRRMARAGARLRRRVGAVLSPAANPPIRRPGARLAVALWSAALDVVPAKSAAAVSAHWGLGTASLFGAGTAYAKATARSHFAAALRGMASGPAVSRWRSAFVKDLSTATRKNRADIVAAGASKVLEHDNTTLADGVRAVRLLEAAAEAAPTATDTLITLAFVAETPPACLAGAHSTADAAIDRPRTALYTRRAAALGSIAGINNTGTCYQGGFGVAGGPDLPLAIGLFARAAAAGHAIAWRNLGLLCEESNNPLGLPLGVASRLMFRCYVSGGGVSALLADWPAAAAVAAGTSPSRVADREDGGDNIDVDDESDEEATDTAAVVAAWAGILPGRSVDVKASDADAECIAFAAQAAELGTGVPLCVGLARRLYSRAVEVATAVATRSRRAGNDDAAAVAHDVMTLCQNKLAGELADDEDRDDSEEGAEHGGESRRDRGAAGAVGCE